jgi:hypothetical protein
VERAWRSLDGHRDTDIERFVSLVVPLVLAGERTIAQLTHGFLVQAGVDPEPLRTSDVTGVATRGADPAEVYRRPGVTVWTALSRGASYEAAVSQGSTRALNLAMTDLQLARTKTVQRVGVTRFKRTLSGLENCDLCALASGNTYYRGDLMPIHAGCDCGIVPVTYLAPSDLPSGVVVHEHGELGPVLAREGDHFTGPDDIDW